MPGGLTALFVGSLLASTLVPGGVEGLLYVMVQDQIHSTSSLWLTASIGNTIGGVLTWWVGLLLYRGLSAKGWQDRVGSLFRIKNSALLRVRKWGPPVLLLSWMPIIGDPLCLAAGYLRMNFILCATMIAIGKFARYLILLWVLQNTL